MRDSFNIWTGMTHADRCRDGIDHGKYADFPRKLGAAGRFHMQEAVLTCVDEGWVLWVFSADECDGEVAVLIPSDVREPVRVMADRVGMREYHHCP